MKKATREQSKWHNTSLVLRTIYNHPQTSRAEIARTTDLTPAAISGLVDDLIQAGWIRENGVGLSSGGKRPTLLTFNENAKVIIGLELSDEYFCGSLITLQGKILSRTSVAVEERKGEEVIALVIALIRQLLTFARQPILGIGVGCQGVIDHMTGTVLQAVRLDWRNIPLKQILEAEFNYPVMVLNDSRAAALAQYAFGKEPIDNLVLLRMGAGVSMGILLNGKIHIGDGFGAGEIGHVAVKPGGDLCYCGHHGCLATIATTRAMLKEARQIFRLHPDSVLNRLVSDPALLTMSNIVAAFREGDPYILDMVREVGTYLGHELAALVCLLNIQHIYIAGVLSSFGEPLLAMIRQKLSERCLESLASKTRVEICDLGDDVTMLGAAAALLREKLGIV